MLVSIDFSYFFCSFLPSFPQALSIAVMFTGVDIFLIIIFLMPTSVIFVFLKWFLVGKKVTGVAKNKSPC